MAEYLKSAVVSDRCFEKSAVILVKLFLDGLFVAVSRYSRFNYFIYSAVSEHKVHWIQWTSAEMLQLGLCQEAKAGLTGISAIFSSTLAQN